MKNLLYILLTTIVILSLSKDRQCIAQNYADKNYYLVDSLDLEAITKTERQLVDSCLKVYHKAKDDTTKINAINVIVVESWDDNIWPKYNNWIYVFVQEKLKHHNYPPTHPVALALNKALAGALNNIGYIYDNQGDIPKALEYYHKSLKIYEEIGDKEGIATSLNNIGFIYMNQGDIPKALEYYHNSLKIREEIGDKRGIARSLNNIGGIYKNQGDIPKALEYWHKSLKIQEEIGNKQGIATSLNNIGYIYDNQARESSPDSVAYRERKLTLALEYYHKSLKILEEIGNKRGIASSLNNIGGIYDNQARKSSPDSVAYRERKRTLALEYYHKSLKIREEIGNKQGITYSLNNIGQLKFEQGGVVEAKEYANKGLQLAQELGFPDDISKSSALLSKIAVKQGNYAEAFKMYQLHITMRDSLNNEATQKATAQQQAKYEYEKQKAIDDKEHEKQLAIEQEAKKKQTILTIATGAGLGLVGIFLLFVFNRLKVTRKQKGIIEQAHTELEEKNTEILDSITYAKRIQNAILPPQKVVKQYLQQSFILYKPKDIVAGDFYWMETISSTSLRGTKQSAQNDEIASSCSGVIRNDELILFAAADCTGHGVPGAMVSVVCNNGLNRSVREHNLTDPGEILTKTREIVVAEFEKSEEEVKDGMDIALCSLSVNSNQSTVLQYAGAHNPLWIISPVTSSADEGSVSRSKALENHLSLTTDNCLLYEIKANKQPIGQTDNPQPYTTHTIELQKGDTIYIFSDGFADQFGGEKGKKLKAANFKKLLLSIQNETMEKQRQLIDEAFENWKGNLEQLDDVCIIGVRI